MIKSHFIVLKYTCFLFSFVFVHPNNLRYNNNNNQNSAAVCLPYKRGTFDSKSLQSNIRMAFKSSSTLWRYHSQTEPHSKEDITKNHVQFILYICGKVYKDKTSCPLKFRGEENWKAEVWGQTLKSCMFIYIERETGKMSEDKTKSKGMSVHMLSSQQP